MQKVLTIPFQSTLVIVLGLLWWGIVLVHPFFQSDGPCLERVLLGLAMFLPVFTVLLALLLVVSYFRSDRRQKLYICLAVLVGASELVRLLVRPLVTS
jgi:hypothetical protein